MLGDGLANIIINIIAIVCLVSIVVIVVILPTINVLEYMFENMNELIKFDPTYIAFISSFIGVLLTSVISCILIKIKKGIRRLLINQRLF
ncbi:hypothetical protein BH09PAT1_BH09PAT1_3200 [soil metagenome]